MDITARAEEHFRDYKFASCSHIQKLIKICKISLHVEYFENLMKTFHDKGGEG